MVLADRVHVVNIQEKEKFVLDTCGCNFCLLPDSKIWELWGKSDGWTFWMVELRKIVGGVSGLITRQRLSAWKSDSLF